MGRVARESPVARQILVLQMAVVVVLVVTAVALFFSVAAHPVEGALFAFVVALAGHVTGDLVRLGELLSQGTAGDPGAVDERPLPDVVGHQPLFFPEPHEGPHGGIVRTTGQLGADLVGEVL